MAIQQTAPKSVGVSLSNFMDDIKKRALTNTKKKRTIDEIATNLNSKEVSIIFIYTKFYSRAIQKSKEDLDSSSRKVIQRISKES